MKNWHFRLLLSTLVLLAFATLISVPKSLAIGSQQNPQSGSVGLEGTIPSAPPTRAATIAVPGNGQTFTTSPITISGLCTTGMLVKVFTNNVFAGSVQCTNGSYQLKADLFSGRNDLVARIFDSLDQAGPDSNLVSVTFNDAQFAQFGSHVTLSSSFARMGANPGSKLTWPIILSGGVGPYAVSIDWGDGKGIELKSVSFAGIVNLTHTYDHSGVYTVIAKATDANGTSAYLQLVGVANGKITGAVGNTKGNGNIVIKYIILWQPLLILIPLMLLAFWLGRRHELFTIRRRLDESRREA